MGNQGVKLDPTIRGAGAKGLENFLKNKVVGQDEAIEKMVEVYQMYLSGITRDNHPIANLLFLGPTGVGKTYLVESFAEGLYGDPHACIKIDCGEFQHSHEIAKLVGSPPSYAGHRETPPRLSQERLDKWFTDKTQISIILFDEIEKASDALWNLLLGILDKATLTLGTNLQVDFSKSIIVMTSNLGSEAMLNLQEGSKFGFTNNVIPKANILQDKVRSSVIDAARKKFSPEFMNRIDKLLVFNPLKEGQIREILDKEISYLQNRVFRTKQNNRFSINCSDAVKDLIMQDGLDIRYGARHLNRSLDTRITPLIANLITSEQIGYRDSLMIDLDENKELVFTKSPKRGRKPKSQKVEELVKIINASDLK